jgi:hypothetical protein
MKPRAAWPVLAKKAKEKCDEAQAVFLKAKERVAQLEQSRQRMLTLYDDYVVRCKEAEKRPHSMAETLNFRGFMQQLQGLAQRGQAGRQCGRRQDLVQRRARQAINGAEGL